MNRLSARFYLERQDDGPFPDEETFSPVRADRHALDIRRARIEVRDSGNSARKLIYWIRKAERRDSCRELRRELRFLLRQRRRWKAYLRELESGSPFP